MAAKKKTHTEKHTFRAFPAIHVWLLSRGTVTPISDPIIPSLKNQNIPFYLHSSFVDLLITVYYSNGYQIKWWLPYINIIISI